jgi:predicted RNA binding protein YcfA (HicA-like mRNA interferase family)
MSDFPSLKVGTVLRILEREPLSYSITRQKGSHRTMYSGQGYGRVLLSGHKGQEMTSNHVKKLFVDQVGLTVEDALNLLTKRKGER